MNHTHALDLLRRKKTELDLLDGAQGRLGEGEEDVRHVGDGGLMDGVQIRPDQDQRRSAETKELKSSRR